MKEISRVDEGASDPECDLGGRGSEEVGGGVAVRDRVHRCSSRQRPLRFVGPEFFPPAHAAFHTSVASTTPRVAVAEAQGGSQNRAPRAWVLLRQ